VGKDLYSYSAIGVYRGAKMVSQISSQEVSSSLSRFFEFLDNVTEDMYYILHLVMEGEPILVIADAQGGTALTIQHPEQIYILQPLLTLLLDEGIPVSGHAEIILAITGEQILSMLG